MRNLLALAGLGLVVFVGLGWYLGWYKFQTTPTADGHRQIQIDLDTKKIKGDISKGESKVRDLIAEKEGTNTQTPNNNPPANGTPTSFRPDEGTFVFPGSTSGGGQTLPTPQ